MLLFSSQFSDIRLILAVSLSLCAVLIISFTLHEFAHAFVAYKCGDYTAKAQGRLTLNPLAHTDLMGFLCCFLFCFGWAKPVPINPLHFRNYKKGIILTSIAGIIVNIILAFIGCGLLYVYVIFIADKISNEYLHYMLLYFFNFLFTINISLFLFNLLPIPPLDGFNVLAILTKYENRFVSFMRRYGTIILFAILIFGSSLWNWLVSLVGLPIDLFWSWIFNLF